MCLVGYEVVEEQLLIEGPKSAGTTDFQVYAPSGKRVLSAGFREDIVRSEPSSDGSYWEFKVQHGTIDSNTTFSSHAYVVCADVHVCEGSS